MQDIRFKAWVPHAQQMFEVRLIDYGNKWVGIKGWVYRDYGDTATKGKVDRISFDKVELLQYTGLKDKNGKEIYESDLVKIEDGIYRVMWSDKVARFTLQIKSGSQGGRNFRMVKFGEVIGNIYEHPERLK